MSTSRFRLHRFGSHYSILGLTALAVVLIILAAGVTFVFVRGSARAAGVSSLVTGTSSTSETGGPPGMSIDAGAGTTTATPTSTPACIQQSIWREVPNPSPTPAGATRSILAVEAVSANDAWAVGGTVLSARSQPLIEHWDGAQWSVMSLPDYGPDSYVLNAVTAIAADNVWAVGEHVDGLTFHHQPLALHWDGTAWALVLSSSPLTGLFTSVSGSAANDVWAVGTVVGSPSATFTMHWDGITWSIVSTPALEGDTMLQGIAALAHNDAWAVGQRLIGGYTRGLILHWDGTAWTEVTGANLYIPGSLRAITAISSQDIWAVGVNTSVQGDTLIVHWDGSAWNLVPGPPAGGAYPGLASVSATSAIDVWAVGYTFQSAYRPFIIHWNGSTWGEVTSAQENSTYKLTGVSVTSPYDAWAVGNSEPTAVQPLTERYSAQCDTPTATITPTFTRTRTFTRTPTRTFTNTSTPITTPLCGLAVRSFDSPDLGSIGARLYDLAAVSANDIWAVGVQARDLTPYQNLVEHWDGTVWSIVPVPNPGSWDHLYGVVAISHDDVWAVGSSTLHWNGSAWSQVQTPSLPNSGYELHDLSATSPNDVWAVGYSYPIGAGSPTHTLALHWDGTRWTIISTPNPDTNTNILTAVSAISPDDVWAVGYHDNQGPRSQSLAMHWDGSAWSVVTIPNPQLAYDTKLSGITAVSTNDVWAVGTWYDDNANHYYGLTMHWDGNTWSIIPSVNSDNYNTYLLNASALSANDAWVVGYLRDGSAYYDLIEHWNGSAWTIVSTPHELRYREEVPAVAAVAPDDVWVAGYYRYYAGQQSYDRTFMLRYYDPCQVGTPTPIPSPTPRCPGGRFSDVCPGDYFYQAVIYLSDHGAISGYSDGTFRPFNNTTRGQLSKIVVLAEGWSIDTTGAPHFSDVQSNNPFYSYIETAYNHHVISGYADGTFRWGNNVTRGQLSKIIVSAEGWSIDTSGGPHFSDVNTSSTFYDYVETAYNHSIISGYADGTFRPGNNATRGQISKIVYNAVTQP